MVVVLILLVSDPYGHPHPQEHETNLTTSTLTIELKLLKFDFRRMSNGLRQNIIMIDIENILIEQKL